MKTRAFFVHTLFSLFVLFPTILFAPKSDNQYEDVEKQVLFDALKIVLPYIKSDIVKSDKEIIDHIASLEIKSIAQPKKLIQILQRHHFSNTSLQGLARNYYKNIVIGSTLPIHCEHLPYNFKILILKQSYYARVLKTLEDGNDLKTSLQKLNTGNNQNITYTIKELLDNGIPLKPEYVKSPRARRILFVLDLSSLRISDTTGIENIPRIKEITILILSNNTLETGDISSMPNLKELYLDNNNIIQKPSYPNLEYLDISNNPCTPRKRKRPFERSNTEGPERKKRKR